MYIYIYIYTHNLSFLFNKSFSFLFYFILWATKLWTEILCHFWLCKCLTRSAILEKILKCLPTQSSKSFLELLAYWKSCEDRVLKNMTWCNNLEFIIYLFIFQFHFYLSLFHALHFMSILAWHLLHCTWFECIMSYTKDSNHRFLTNT